MIPVPGNLLPSHILTFQVPSHWPLDTSHSPHTGTSQVKQYFLKKIKSDCWWWIFHIDDLISPRNKCQPYSRRHSVHIYWKYSSDQFIWYWLLRDLSGNFQQSFLAVALSLLAGSSVWLLEPCLRRWEVFLGDTIASKKNYSSLLKKWFNQNQFSEGMELLVTKINQVRLADEATLTRWLSMLRRWFVIQWFTILRRLFVIQHLWNISYGNKFAKVKIDLIINEDNK